MRWFKRLLAGALVLLMSAAVLVYLIPLDVYVPEVEQNLSARLQVPVRVGSLHAGALPLPHLELRDVLVGGQEGIALRSVEVSPKLAELLAGRLAMHVTVRDGAAHFAPLRMLVESLSHALVAGRGPVVRELRLSGMILLMPEVAFGPLEGKLEFGRTAELQHAWFALDEQKLTAVLSPLPERKFALQVKAKNWVEPHFLNQSIDALQLDGVLGEQDIIARSFSIATGGMLVAGSGRLDFSDGLEFQAALAQAEVPLARLMALLKKPVGLTGLMSGNGKVAGKGADWEALAKDMRFAGDLRITDATVRIAESFRRPLTFDDIRSHVAVRPQQVELTGLEVALYGGRLSGDMGFDRNNSVLDGKLAVRGVDMSPLVEALTNEVLITGNLESEAKFSMRMDRLERFSENLKLAGKFHLRKGTLGKVDLAQVANNPGKMVGAGGMTKFDDLSGALSMDASGYHFRNLKISSGSLNADGRIGISPSLGLKGVLEVDVKGTAGLVSMPLVISGTLDEPVIRVSSSALAGAAVGTAIMGPGLGTALGVKVGGFLNKLFGGSERRN